MKDTNSATTVLVSDINKPVFLFSGQGSQKPGMGASVINHPTAKDVFTCASDIFGFDVVSTMIDAEPEILNDTRIAQPVIVTLSLALSRIIEDFDISPSAVLGFSLGQITALEQSGMLNLEETLKLTKQRAHIMAEEAQAKSGAMCALLGAEEADAQKLCTEQAHDDVLVIANYNSPGQIVISGSIDAIERAQTAWADNKKKSVRLATSGAFHSPLMKDAANRLRVYLETIDFAAPSIPLICNIDACPLSQSEATDHLVDHLTSPVRFQQSVELLHVNGIETFIEVGYGGTLINLVKRIARQTKRYCVQDMDSANAVREQLSV